MATYSKDQRAWLLQIRDAITNHTIATQGQFKDIFRLLLERGVPLKTVAEELRTPRETVLAWSRGENIPDDEREWGWMMNVVAALITKKVDEETIPPKNKQH